MSFQQGLSGLNASSKALDSVGNNIANSGTIGFKSASTAFADVFASSLGGGSQVGIGTSVAGINQQFTQGNITVTNNPLDLALNGSGFFRLSNNGSITWTRNGQFNLDKDGFIVSGAGYRLTGYLANESNVIVPSTPAEIYINTSDLQPQPTGGAAGTGTGVEIGLNLDSREDPPATMVPSVLTGTTTTPGLTITAANNQITVSADGVTSGTITIPSAVYASSTALASAVESAINGDTTLAAAGALVDVSVDTAGHIVITSRRNASTSAVTVDDAGATTGATSLLGAASQTGAVANTGFNISDPTTYNSSTSATVYDSLGNPHLMSLYFLKTGANTWNIYTSLDGANLAGPTVATFNSVGALTAPANGIISQTYTSAQLGTGAAALTFPLNLTGSTQYGNIFGVNSITQDGYTSGRLAGLSVASDGTVQGRYSNGQTRDLAQVVLGNFTNPNGLTSLGNNQWSETADSGQPLIGVPGSGSLGVIQSAAIEESNVDLTAELVQMITYQRAYQANAQTIKTQDSVLQTLVNLR